MNFNRLLLSLVLLCFQNIYSKPIQNDMEDRYLKVGDQSRRYSVFVPESLSSKNRRRQKLVIDFRGFYDSAWSDDLIIDINAKASGMGHLVVYPRADKTDSGIWSFKNKKEVEFTQKIAKDMIQNYNIDIHQIYVNGYKNWPFIPYKIALEHPHLIAEPTKEGEYQEFSTIFKGESRRYTVFLPYDWRLNKSKLRSALVDLRGLFLTPTGLPEIARSNYKANKAHQILIYPHAGEDIWKGSNIIEAPIRIESEFEFFDYVLEEVSSVYKLDPNRIHYAGIGFWPFMSDHAAKSRPHLLALPFYEGKLVKMEVQVKNETHFFTTYVPNLWPLENRPLIIDFRKYFASPAEQHITMNVNTEALRTGHFFVYPLQFEKLSKTYLESERIEITEKIIEKMIRKFAVDPSRIFVTGHSSEAVTPYPVPLEPIVGQVPDGRVIKHTIVSDGKPRKYSVFVPHNFSNNPDKKIPLILDYHAFFIMPWGQMAVTGMNEEANRRGYLVAYPRAGIGIWNNGNEMEGPIKDFDDIKFTEDVIKEMIQKYNVDPERIYMTGYSSGALMAYRTATELPHLIAAFSAVAGSLNVDIDPKKSLPIPLMHIHGVYDGIVPLLRDGLAGINSVADSIKTWTGVNKTRPYPIVNQGVLEAPYKNLPFKIRYKRHVYLPEQEDGEIIDFYQLKNTFHIFPLSMHRYTNPRMLDFFSKYKRKIED